MHEIAGADTGRLVVGALPPFQVGHEHGIAVRVADDFPDRIPVGVDDAPAFDAHQPITGNRRREARRSTPPCRLAITLSCTASSAPSTSIGCCTSIEILVGSGIWPARSLTFNPHGN